MESERTFIVKERNVVHKETETLKRKQIIIREQSINWEIRR